MRNILVNTVAGILSLTLMYFAFIDFTPWVYYTLATIYTIGGISVFVLLCAYYFTEYKEKILEGYLKKQKNKYAATQSLIISNIYLAVTIYFGYWYCASILALMLAYNLWTMDEVQQYKNYLESKDNV